MRLAQLPLQRDGGMEPLTQSCTPSPAHSPVPLQQHLSPPAPGTQAWLLADSSSPGPATGSPELCETTCKHQRLDPHRSRLHPLQDQHREVSWSSGGCRTDPPLVPPMRNQPCPHPPWEPTPPLVLQGSLGRGKGRHSHQSTAQGIPDTTKQKAAGTIAQKQFSLEMGWHRRH